MARKVTAEPPEITLPDSINEFRRMLGHADYKQREAIVRAIQAEYRGFRRVLGGVKKVRDSESLRRFEALTIEFLRHCGRSPSRDWDFSVAEAIDHLAYIRSPSAPRVFRTLLRSDRFWLRKEAADALAWLAFDHLLPEVVRLIQSREPAVACEALRGAGRAITYRWTSAPYKRRILAECVPLVTGKRKVPRTEYGHTLLVTATGELAEHDPRGSSKLFPSEACLRPDNPALRSVLLALRSMRDENPKRFRAPDPAPLWSLFDAAKTGKVATFPHLGASATLTALLALTAHTDPARTNRECATLLKEYPDEWHVKNDAKDILRRCRSLPKAHSCLIWMYENPGRLPAPAVLVMRAYEFVSHTEADGFPAYFDNAGELWREALAGLELIGASKAAAILTRGAEAFTPGGPPADVHEARALSLALTDDRRAHLEKIGKEYARVNNQVLAAVDKYIAAHASQFDAVRA
jgi:hypothetical protein